MSDDTTTIDDLRDGEEHDEEASDREVVFDEFEYILKDLKKAIYALRSGGELDAEQEAIECVRFAAERTAALQNAVLDYMAEVESELDEDEDEDEDEEEEEEEGGEEDDAPSSSEEPEGGSEGTPE